MGSLGADGFRAFGSSLRLLVRVLGLRFWCFVRLGAFSRVRGCRASGCRV